MLRDHPLESAFFSDMAQAIWRDDGDAFERLAVAVETAREQVVARLRIHSGTTWHSLTCALAEAVPSVASLTSAAAFEDLARDFIACHPPRQAALHEWGDELPAFLASRGALPELIAFARLDRAWMASFFSVEAEPIGPTCLGSLPPSVIPQVRLVVHPSVRLVRLDDTLFDRWRACAVLPQLEHDREAEADGHLVMMSRPWAHIHARALTPDSFAFLEALRSGATLLDACEAALAADSGFDLQAHLAAAFAAGVFTDCLTKR